MTGHGRPPSLTVALARVALALASCALPSRTAVGQDAPTTEPLSLRITWGGGDARPWVGRLRFERGSLSDLQLLGIDADAAGSVWLEGSTVQVRSLSPHRTDGIEVSATGAADARLSVEFADGSQAAPIRADVPLADLARRPFQLRLDDRGNTLDVRLAPSPSVRIAFNNAAGGHMSQILARGSELVFDVEPILPAELHGTTLDIHTTLSPARHHNPVWSDVQKLAVPVDGSPQTRLTVPLQVAEGAYLVRIAVSRPSGYFRDRFFPGAATPLAERTFSIVVLEAEAASSADSGRWEQVLEIDPTNPRWVERLPTWTRLRRIPGINNLNPGAFGSLRAGTVDLKLGRFIELPPIAGGADPHWQAYSLPLENTGTPHLLEVDYPADAEQHFGLSIVEPNAIGVIEGIQRDAGVYIEGLGRSEVRQKESHPLLFWPRTQSPLLVVTNQHPSLPAHFGRIRVLRRVGRLANTPREPTGHRRLVAAYLARPFLAESFGASQAADSAEAAGTHVSIADHQTFFESATRLAEYTRYAGFNSAIVNVMADGSSLYPSSQELFTPRYLCSHARDNAIDGLELLLRVFDRERLTLVPAVQFATPLAQLEALRRASDPQSSGVELVGPDGRTWLEANGARNGLAPYYNLLDPRVQRAILAVVGEIVERYATHPAFGGLAVQLTSDGYAQLPPSEWGLDDATVERFSRDTGITIAGPGPNRFAARHAALTGQHSAAWRTWRARQVADFYQRLADLVSANGQRRLLLTTEKLFDHPVVSERIRPNLLSDNRVAATLLDLGIDRSLLGAVPGIVLCPTRYLEPMSPLPDRAIDLELNAAHDLPESHAANAASSASVLYHPSTAFRLASFALSSPYRVAGEMRPTSHAVAGGAHARQEYLHAIAHGDPTILIDGGDVLPLGQEETLRNIRTLVSELPLDANVSDLSQQTLVVRTYVDSTRTTIVVMNTAPWRVTGQVAWNVTEPTTLQPVATANESASGQPQPISLATGRQIWPVALGPYEFQAVRIVTGKASVADLRGEFDAAAAAELKGRIDDLASRDLSAPRPLRALSNPSFEPLNGAVPLPGWHTVGSAKSVSAVLDATNPQDGKTSLYLRNAGQFAAVESDPFSVPPTGQLSMTVFARGQNIGPGADLRLVFESENDGRVYRRAASVPGTQTQRENQHWGRPFAILVNDLPLDSRGQMRLKFELTGPGELWLDNVKLNDLLFSQKFYQHSQAEIVRLLQRVHEVQTAYDEGQLRECLQLLEGYWPRFVLAYTPAATPVVALGTAPEPAAAPAPPAPAAPPANQEPPPAGFQDRLKRMVPLLR